MTNSKTSPAQIRRALKQLERLRDTLWELERNLPEAINVNQEITGGALSHASERLSRAIGSVSNAVRYASDNRSNAEIEAEQVTLRAEMARAETIRRYGCAA